MASQLAMALVALTAAACTATTPTPIPIDVHVDSTFELAIGQSVRLREPGVTIQLVAVLDDSRCPTGAQVRCVWAGNGRVRLQVERGDQTDTLDLNTMLDPREQPAGPLSIRLVALTPERTESKAIPLRDYRATLVASLRTPLVQ